MKKLIIALVCFVLLVQVASALKMDVYVRPVVGGELKPNQAFTYEFNFTSDAGCTNVLNSVSSVITTDFTGTGYAQLDLGSVTTTPSYICEYRGGSLRKVHTITSLIADEVWANDFFGNINASYVQNPPWLTSFNETDPTFNASNYYNKSEQSNWDWNVSDDFNGSWSSLTGIPADIADGDNDTTYTNVSEFVNDAGYLTSFTESDPVFAAQNGTLARTGNCPSGQFVVNTTTGGVQCAAPAAVVESDPVWSGVASNYVQFANTTNWDKNVSDDFDGTWASLSGIPAGFQDGVDNDTLYYNLSEFNNDVGFITGYNETDPIFTAANSTLARTGNCPSGQFVVNTTTGGVQCAVATTAETDPVFTAWNYSWNNLTGVPAGFVDGIDNDTMYTNLSEFNNDVGFITGTVAGNITITDNSSCYYLPNGGSLCSGIGPSGKECTVLYSPDKTSNVKVCNN